MHICIQLTKQTMHFQFVADFFIIYLCYIVKTEYFR